MKITQLPLPGLKLIELKIHGDERGFFTERFREDALAEAGITSKFVQDNHSRSAPGILRGLHYQRNPDQQKLVGVVRGRIFDVAVDLRSPSPTYGQWYGVELSDMNGRLLWVPAGFAHGFYVMGDQPADLLYKVDSYYTPAGEGGILWNDPEVGIKWPTDGKEPLLSQRDRNLSTFAEYKKAPRF